MDAKTIKNIRQRLQKDQDALLKSMNRNRSAVEAMKPENTEDELDLATMSHERDVLYNLQESDFERLVLIRQALKALERGEYGQCVNCEEDINEKRLDAVPWATMCVRCQEAAELEVVSARVAGAADADQPDL